MTLQGRGLPPWQGVLLLLAEAQSILGFAVPAFEPPLMPMLASAGLAYGLLHM